MARSLRPPLVLATAALAVAIVLDRGAGADAIGPLVLLALLVPITLIDLDRRLIPNRITGPGALAAVVIGALVDPAGLPGHLVAGLAAAGLLFVAAVVQPSGMGMGDVKLAGMLGLFLGRDVGVALLVALLAGSVAGLGIIARKGTRAGRKTHIPFGPFLAFGALVPIFAGEPIVHWYLDAFR